ncbi:MULTISPECIES: LytS family sensor histidine kinase [Olivibacter]|uniref:Histidine kinase n=1 Tax=Olivibacter jilunii TaxID=985016 RepID=A0ABW6B9G6_9SPHI|nr:hypothetical protein [Pseudosphingobacterium sp.]
MERNIERKNTFEVISRLKNQIESFWFTLVLVVALISYQQWLLEADLFAPDANILLNQLIYYGLIYAAFHLNIRYLFPHIFSNIKGWWWKVPLFIGGESLLLFLIAVIISVLAGRMEVRMALAFFDFSELYHKKAVLGPWVLYTGLNLGYYFCWQAFHLLSKLWVTKRVRDDLEQELTASQIQTENRQAFHHLWYHLLSLAKDLIPTKPKKAVKIIELIRYMLRYHGMQMEKLTWVTLQDELRFMRLLLLASRLRNGDVQVFCDIDHTLLDKKCMPISLIVLLENMIGHSILDNKRQPAVITIRRIDNTLQFTTENKIKKSNDAEHLHIGLQNLKSRLIDYYEDKAKLDVSIKDDIFYTCLKLPIIG